MSENPININVSEDFLKGAAVGAAAGAALGAIAYSKYKKHKFVYGFGKCPKCGSDLRLTDKQTITKGKTTYVYGIYKCENGHKFKVLLEKHIVKKRPA
ncbi:MAG: hypothetical protein DRJ38_04065 [Thermoprotei archaeon]|nr:MAG: hypothetical protein DRJ38_04065 [Thermoprotei archaeon]